MDISTSYSYGETDGGWNGQNALQVIIYIYVLLYTQIGLAKTFHIEPF